MGVSSVDGITPISLRCDPVTGYLLVNIVDTTTVGSVTPSRIAKHDQNHITTKMGVSSDLMLQQNLITHNGYLAVTFL